jgi:hypothetical protein
VFCFNVALCRAISSPCAGRILLSEYLFLLFYFSFSVMLVDLYYFYFCFSCSGWGIGPCGGVVEPDFVARIRSDEGSGDNFFYGPSVMVPYREPFANECYLFGDSRYHACGKYADLEKKFFSGNEEVMREIFFDTNNLLGMDSDEDIDEDVPMNYDVVPEILSEDDQLRRDRVKEISEMDIVRLSPFKSDGEDGGTMERMASPVVVETVNDLADAGVATCSTDSGVDNQYCSEVAAEPDCVEKIVAVRVELPFVPGPFSEDVGMDDFLPRTRRGPVLFLTFRKPASGEVSVYFVFSLSSVVFCVFIFWSLIKISV